MSAPVQPVRIAFQRVRGGARRSAVTGLAGLLVSALIVTVAPPALAASAVAAAPPMTQPAQRAEAGPAVSFLEPEESAQSSTTSPQAPSGRVVGSEPAPPPAAANSGQQRWAEPEESRPDEASASARAKETGKPVAIEASLSERRAVYAHPDGTLTESLTSLPARVRRGQGWAKADPTLVARGGRVVAAATQGELSLSGGGDSDAAVLVGKAGQRLVFGSSARLPKPAVLGDRATYAEVQPGVDMVWHARVTGAEQSFVLKRRPVSAPVFRIPLGLPSGVTAVQDGDGVKIVDAAGEVVAYVGGTRTFGASRNPQTDEPTHQVASATTVEQGAGGPVLVVAPPSDFLADPDVVYPVTVDPSITMVYTGQDTYVDRSFPSSSYSSSTELHVGYYNPGLKRSFITFDTSQLPGKAITGASLRLWSKYSWSCSATGVTVHNAGGSSASTTWNTQPGMEAARDGASSFAKGYSASCPAGLVYLPVTNLAQFWSDQRVTAAAVGIKASNEGDVFGYKKFNSGNDGSYFPEIQVTYSAPPNVPSSLSPSSGAVVSSTTPVLSGVLSDPDSANVEGRFYLYDSAGTLLASPPAAAGIVSSGSRISYGVPSSAGLRPGQTYSWLMQACQSANSCSANTATHTFTVQATTPSAPTGLSASPGDTSATASWQPPSSDGGSAITDYGWDLRGSDGSVRSGRTGSALTRTVTVGGLTNGASYTFTVWAVNARGAGTSVSSGAVTPSGKASVPQNVSAAVQKTSSAASREEVVVGFDRSFPNGSAITRYDVTVLQNGSVLRTDQCTACASGTGRVSYTVPSTTVGQRYAVQVRAVNANGSSSPSAVSNEVIPAAAPSAPSGVTVTERVGAASPTVTLSWTAGSNGHATLTGHTAYVYDSAGTLLKTQPLSCTGSCTTGEVTGLTRGSTYSFSVEAHNRVGSSGPSAKSAAFRVHTPPALAKTVGPAADSLLPAVHRRGETVQYTVTVKNTNSDAVTLTSLQDVLPAGVSVPAGSVLLDGVLCTGCTADSGKVLLKLGNASGTDAGTLPGNATATFTYLAVLGGSERDCLSGITNAAQTATVWGPASTSVTSTACAGGLGLEPWWSFWSTEVGPAQSASVNAANGNLSVTATDSTPVQGHGRTAYVLRRSYNSQELTAATLPGSLGAGWALNLGHTDELAGVGVTGTGLVVPRVGDLVEKITNPLALTLVDRDGTRHMFNPNLMPAVPVAGLTGELAALKPTGLTAPAGRTLCVDLAYTAPAGVHLGLWRYVGVDGACDTVTASTDKVVVGYAAVRPDRLRTEYAATGQLLALTDGAGNTLRYAYEGSPTGVLTGGVVLPGKRLALVYEPNSCTAAADSAGNPTVPQGCRAFRLSYPGGAVAVTDPAGRTTTYKLSQVTVAGLPAPVQVLAEVVNPTVAASSGSVTYRYQGDPAASPALTDCGGSPLQLCSITDPNGAVTRFTYTRSGTVLAGLGRIATVAERPRDSAGSGGAAGTATTFSYPSRQVTTAVRGGSQQRAWTGLDGFGRAGQVLDGPVGDATAAGYPAAHATVNDWDGNRRPDGTTIACEQLAPGQSSRGQDHKLCGQTVKGSANASGAPTPDRRTDWLYDNAGSMLRANQNHKVVRVVGTDTDGRPSYQVQDGTPAVLTTTYGYTRQHITSGGGRSDTTFSVGAAGAVTGGGAQAAGSELFTLSDRTQMLPPRGNAPGAAWESFRSTWTVDNASGNPNRRPADGLCSPGVPASNTGLVCAQSSPYRTPSGVDSTATTTFTFDAFGQRATMTTAKANAEPLADGGPAGSYRYVYYADSDRDLTGGTSAGGWLKAVVDPTGAYVAFAHDRAGNTVRTWDRNATVGRGSPQAFDIASDRHSGTLYGTGPEAMSKPWRWATASSDALGNRTSQQVDAHGYVTAIRPPRGNAAGDASHDTVLTVNAWGQPLTVATPEHPDRATRHSYDAFGNTVRTTDGRGAVATVQFDVVNRPERRTFVRGAYDAGTAPPACRPSDSSAAEAQTFGAGKLLCSTSTAYDTHDNPVVTVDADGQRSHAVYDSAGRATVAVTPRRDLDPGSGQSHDPHVVTETVYDATVADRTCTPRQFDPAEPDATRTCGEQAVHGVHTSYDIADRAMTTTTFRAAGQPLTRTVGYDANGNPVATTDARGTTSTAVFDQLDRRVRSTVPRASSQAHTTAWHHDPVGNTVAVVRPGAAGDNTGAGGAGTDVRITGYSYDHANRRIDTVQALQVPSADPTGPAATDAITEAVATARPDERAQTNLRTRVGYDRNSNPVNRWNERAFVHGSLAEPDDRFVLRTGYDRNNRPVTERAPRYTSGTDTLAADPTGSAQQAAECPTGASDYPGGVGVCTTTLAYDANGNITDVTLPDDPADTTPRRLTYAYTADNLVERVTAPNPAADGQSVTVAAYQHDATGRPVKSTNASGQVTVTAYTADGLTSSVAGPPGPGGLAPRTDWQHNAAGQQTKTLTARRTYSPDSSAPTGNQTLVTATAYTVDGLVAATTTGGTDPALPDGGGSLTTRYAYDPNGNPTEVASPNAVARDAANQAGAPTRYTYTLDDLLETTVQPVTVGATGVLTARTTRYSYDPAGRKTAVDTDTTGAAGDPLTFAYYPSDALRATSGRASAGGGTISRGYDATGAPVLVEQRTGTATSTLTSSFYLDGLLAGTAVSSTGVGATGTSRTAFGYDGVGGRTARADATGGSALTVSTFSTSDAALPVAMTDPASGDGPTSWAYNRLGQPTREQLPSGQTQTFAYGSDDTLTRTAVSSTPQLADQVAAGTAEPDLASYAYTYDELGRVLSQAHFGAAAGGQQTGSPTAPVTFRYTYDTAGRLASFADARGKRDLSYDPNGNRTAYGRTGQVDPVSFSYRADDSIATRTAQNATRTFGYNPYGGVTSDGCTTYTHDGFDRLSSASADAGLLAPLTGGEACPAGSASYGYDGLDRQTTATTSTGLTVPVLGSGDTNTYRYDGLSTRIWQRTETSTGATTTLDHALNSDGQVQAVTQTGQQPRYLAGDGHGSTALITTPDRTVDCATRYDAYGSPDTNNPAATAPPTTPCASGTPGEVDVFYRGERRDGSTGNYQLGARTYDPAKAGFLTPDSYRDEQPDANLSLGVDPLTRNSYAYVNGDPINYTDPTGHDPRPNHNFRDPNACAGGACGYKAQAKEYGSDRPKPKAEPREDNNGGGGLGSWLKKKAKQAAPFVAGVAAYAACTAGSAGAGAVACGAVAGLAYGAVHGALNCGSASCVVRETAVNGVIGAAGGVAGKAVVAVAGKVAPGLTQAVTEGVAQATSRASGALQSAVAGVSARAGTAAAPAVGRAQTAITSRVTVGGAERGSFGLGPKPAAEASSGATQLSTAMRNLVAQKAGFSGSGPRLLVDENIGQSVAGGLRNAGYDARSVAEMGLRGAPDSQLGTLADQVGARVLTRDIGRNPGGGFGPNGIVLDDRVRSLDSILRILGTG